jgi:hypothetical protein
MPTPDAVLMAGGLIDVELPKGPGRPRIVWTPSKQRELVRLVEIGTPWQDIPIAIEDRGAGFTPK